VYFLGLPDPHPDPLITSTDPDPSIIKQNSKKNRDFYCYVTSLLLFIFEEWWKCTSVPSPDPYVFGPPGSASGSVGQRFGSGSVPTCHGSPTILCTGSKNCTRKKACVYWNICENYVPSSATGILFSRAELAAFLEKNQNCRVPGHEKHFTEKAQENHSFCSEKKCIFLKRLSTFLVNGRMWIRIRFKKCRENLTQFVFYFPVFFCVQSVDIRIL
jgi:hypothetical protein